VGLSGPWLHLIFKDHQDASQNRISPGISLTLNPWEAREIIEHPERMRE
jgi:hypothetical protein